MTPLQEDRDPRQPGEFLREHFDKVLAGLEPADARIILSWVEHRVEVGKEEHHNAGFRAGKTHAENRHKDRTGEIWNKAMAICGVTAVAATCLLSWLLVWAGSPNIIEMTIDDKTVLFAQNPNLKRVSVEDGEWLIFTNDERADIFDIRSVECSLDLEATDARDPEGEDLPDHRPRPPRGGEPDRPDVPAGPPGPVGAGAADDEAQDGGADLSAPQPSP